jgi:hypothetical protein
MFNMTSKTAKFDMFRRRFDLYSKTAIFILVLLVTAQHFYYQDKVRLLRNAGPIGFNLEEERRWVMSESVAAGVGRRALIELERFRSSNSESSILGKWGEHCWVSGQPHVLVAVPYNPNMPEMLQESLAEILNRIE